MKMSKLKSSKTHHFRRFQTKRISPSFSAHFFTYYSTGQNHFLTFFRIWHFFDIIIIKNCMFLMFWRLGTMLERFFEAKSFRLHISKPKHVPGNTFFDVSKMSIVAMCHGYVSWLCIMAMYHGYVSWLCIMAMCHGYVSWQCVMVMCHENYISQPASQQEFTCELCARG